LEVIAFKEASEVFRRNGGSFQIKSTCQIALLLVGLMVNLPASRIMDVADDTTPFKYVRATYRVSSGGSQYSVYDQDSFLFSPV
jgi:hypothetical protein